MLGTEVLKNINYKSPVFVHTPLISSLKGPGSKMSSSEEGSFISIRDSKENINKKIKKAHCPAKIIKENPILEITKLIIFPRIKKFEIKRPEKFGGNLNLKDYNTLEKEFAKGNIHPLDLKNSVSEYLEEIISPIRKKFK
jgi:tyrosyl-tRNA synthetase